MQWSRGAITDAAGAGDFSYRRPGRRTPGVERFTGRSMMLPALRQPIPQVGIVLDTSGSMGSGRGSRIEQALSEVIGIVRAMRCPVKVWSTDATVATVTRVMPDTDISKLTEGGGGTDMRIGITEAAKDRLDVIVVLTDAITDWPTPKEMPKQRLIAAVVGKHPVPEHIRTIRIPKK